MKYESKYETINSTEVSKKEIRFLFYTAAYFKL